MVEKNETGPHSPQIHGPFSPEYRITIDGFRVPYVNATPLEDGRVSVVIDNRFGLPDPVPREEFDRWIHILAQAMAVAAGYSCHGEHCTPLNPFKIRMSAISFDPKPPTLRVIDGGNDDWSERP